MVLVAVFGVALLIAVLLSGLAARTVLSTSLLFLVGGALVSDGFLGLIHITPDSGIVSVTADLALFAVLFTDGQHVSFAKLRANWLGPARALALGMPLALVFMALVTHWLVGLDWTTSFLVGAVLAPTDPVFASAIVGRKEVPARLRELLNVESGVNDGLALPVVLLLIAAAGPPPPVTLIAVCIAFSIVAHSSTDVPIARMFDVEDLVGIPDDEPDHADPPAEMERKTAV
nr:cation:proton antiporter [Streptomyces shenzhenensis]